MAPGSSPVALLTNHVRVVVLFRTSIVPVSSRVALAASVSLASLAGPSLARADDGAIAELVVTAERRSDLDPAGSWISER